MNHYLRNIILLLSVTITFVVSLLIEVAMLIFFQHQITGRLSGGLVGAGSIGAIVISFLLAKKINKILKSKIKIKE